jgi:hypothetical protein
MSTTRTLLIRALQERLIPVFMGLGFNQLPLSPEDQGSREVSFSFPLGRLRRIKNDGSFELLEIQLDKHGAAKFRLNFGVVPVQGIDHPVKHVDQSEASVQYLKYYCELCSWPLFMKWFSVPSTSSESKVWRLVDRVAGFIPEVEAWFKTDKAGPHVRRVGRPP